MKQIFSILAVGSIYCCMSCNNEKTASETKDNSMAEKNLAATHVVSKAFETGDISGIDSVVASDFVDHTDKGDKGRDSLKAMITTMHAHEKDSKMEVVKELADNDYVMSQMRYSGTSDGYMGMPAGPYDMQAIEVVKFKDGKAVEHWSFMQVSDMMKMMQQPPPPPAGGDKMKSSK
jgi:predicted SnoaL-like aldol condensation-catalyzing enzyme